MHVAWDIPPAPAHPADSPPAVREFVGPASDAPLAAFPLPEGWSWSSCRWTAQFRVEMHSV
jgi:hypothetical protein